MATRGEQSGSRTYRLSNQSILEQCHAIGLSLQDLKIAKTIQTLIKENANTVALVYFSKG